MIEDDTTPHFALAFPHLARSKTQTEYISMYSDASRGDPRRASSPRGIPLLIRDFLGITTTRRACQRVREQYPPEQLQLEQESQQESSHAFDEPPQSSRGIPPR
ncbi:hypothetical protein HN011_000964 [Eciton burchellii]|nr:hypothetical protein HN011_000964 [Eciton burchellii]